MLVCVGVPLSSLFGLGGMLPHTVCFVEGASSLYRSRDNQSSNSKKFAKEKSSNHTGTSRCKGGKGQ